MKKTFKNLYNLLPFKRQIFSLLKKVWVPPAKIYKHLHFKGIITVMANANAKFKMYHHGYSLENELFWQGVEADGDKESIALWIKLSKKAHVVMDVGANTGMYALFTKAVNPASVVYAFEPVERVFKKLDQNINLNKFDIISVKAALSNTKGTAEIHDVHSEHEYAATLNAHSTFNQYDSVSVVETTTLDDFIGENNISQLDLIKIDVETFEPQVIEGFIRHLPVLKPAILIEILSDEIGQKVTELMAGAGYLFFEVDEKAGPIQRKSIRRGQGYNYLLCTTAVARYLGLKYK